MSAAFDNVDHGIFLDSIETRFGITGTAKSWLKSYLNERRTRVSIRNIKSVEHVLNFSVPQCSVIGPQCFTMYTHPVGDIIREYNVNFHVYADDTQLYTEFNPKVAGDSNRALSNLSTCISKTNTWMVLNRLQLNQNKTEFFVFGSPKVISTLPHLVLRAGDTCINPSTTVKNLGVTLDSSLLMNRHFSTVCRSVYFHVRNLWRIRRFLT